MVTLWVTWNDDGHGKMGARAGEQCAYPGEKELSCATMGKDMAETKGGTTYLHQPLSVALPCVTMASSRTTRSIKRRPRSRRDARSMILSCFEQPVVDTGDGCNDVGATTGLQLPDMDRISPNATTFPGSCNGPASRQQQPIPSSATFAVAMTDSANGTSGGGGGGPQNNNITSNNYLEFLLQSDGSLMQNVQIFGPEFPLFLTSSHQWEKLPMIYSEDANSLYEGCNTKDTDSCSPDSVITNFTADVFDSLEPLNSAPSEWWVAQ